MGSCVPTCNIDNCKRCDSFSTCGECEDTFVSNSNSTECACPDTTFEIKDSKCQCPESKLANNNTCITCTVDLCEFCTVADECGGCLNNLILDNNTCSCEDSSYIIEKSTCICPDGTK